MNPEILNSETLPCGCVVGQALVKGIKTFFIDPCEGDCEYYKYTLEEAKRQSKPIEYKEEL